MPPAQFRLVSPEPLAEFLREGRAREALEAFARLANAELTVVGPSLGRKKAE